MRLEDLGFMAMAAIIAVFVSALIAILGGLLGFIIADLYNAVFGSGLNQFQLAAVGSIVALLSSSTSQ